MGLGKCRGVLPHYFVIKLLGAARSVHFRCFLVNDVGLHDRLYIKFLRTKQLRKKIEVITKAFIYKTYFYVLWDIIQQLLEEKRVYILHV